MNAIRSLRALRFAAVTLVGAAAIVAGQAVTPSAQAATGQPVQFSGDGVHWSDSYAGALFGDVLLVPGDSIDRAFYVRNNTAESAVMRVTLYGVATTDTDLAAAMSLSTSTPGFPGASVPVTSAQPCATLSHGQMLAAGDGIRLDNVATLADLTNTSGQAHTVSFKLAISLSSTDAAAPAPDSCPTDFGGTVVGSPDPGSGTTSHPVYHLGAVGWTPAPGEASGPVATPTPTPSASAAPQPSGNPILGSLVGNTERFYQENFVLLWLAMVVIGALLFLFVRRRRSAEDATELYPNSR